MGRSKYPSDYRRWFKVKEDILDDPKLENCSADVFRFYIRLLAMLKRANSHTGQIALGRHALNACAGREQLRNSLRVASTGAEAGLYSLRVDGEQTVITVPKWAESQEITPEPLPSDSDQTPDSRVEQSRVEQSSKRDVALATPPEVMGFAKMLRGKVPTDLNGETWSTREEWLEANADLMIAEARFRAKCDSGPQFRRQFQVVMFRFWKSKTPPKRAARKQTQDELFDQIDRERDAKDQRFN